MTTRLAGTATHFLPFNKGWNGGAGNPPDPAGRSYRTAYLWEEVLACDSFLDLLARFIHLQIEEKRYVTCVPLIPLKAAAGAFSDPQHIEDDKWEWVALNSRHRLRSGMFVAQVVGKSMEPLIPDGAYCLFAAPVTGTRLGKTVLVQLRDTADPETGERYTVKRYESKKAKEGNAWRHSRITLKPLNPDFGPIEITGSDESELQVIAELIEVLGTEHF